MSRQERGATAVEYALMVGLISVGIVGATVTLKGKINSTLGKALGPPSYTSAGTFAGNGNSAVPTIDSTSLASTLTIPIGIAISPSGTVYVSEYYGNRIRKIENGNVTTLAGSVNAFSGSDDLTGTDARFNVPYGLAVDSNETVYVADFGNSKIRKITSAGVVSTLAVVPSPLGITVNAAGIVSVVGLDYTLRQITPAGVVSILTGASGSPGMADGVPGIARFHAPYGLAEDPAGNYYVTEFAAHVIRKVTPAGVVSTVAGSSGLFGSFDATTTQARFTNPLGIAIDNFGNLYVAGYGEHRIRKITPAGVVTTIGGTGDYDYLDGAPMSAKFRSPGGIALAPSGDLYVIDVSNKRVRVLS